MQYSFLKSCLVALAAVSGVVAQTAGFDVFTKPLTPGTSIPAGSTYTIKWTPSEPKGKISILLLQGSSNVTLQLGPTIASSIDSTTGSYDWKVPSSMSPVFAVYGLKIQLDSDPTIFQYSTYFSISGLTTASATGSNSMSASTTVTVVVSSVSATVTTQTLSASLVTINSTSEAATSTAGIYSNTTMTTTTTASASGAAGTASLTSSSATATKSSAAGNVAIGGTGLLGAMMVALGMLL